MAIVDRASTKRPGRDSDFDGEHAKNFDIDYAAWGWRTYRGRNFRAYDARDRLIADPTVTDGTERMLSTELANELSSDSKTKVNKRVSEITKPYLRFIFRR